MDSIFDLKLIKFVSTFSVQVSLARRQPVIDPINDASSRFVESLPSSAYLKLFIVAEFAIFSAQHGQQLLPHTVRRGATETSVRW